MAERTALSTCDPEMLKRLFTLFQESGRRIMAAPGLKHSVEEIRELKKAVAARLLRETERGDFDPARIRERALAGM